MEQILKILKQMLSPDQAQILLKALKNSNNENFYNKQINLIYFKEYNLYKLLKFYFKSK